MNGEFLKYLIKSEMQKGNSIMLMGEYQHNMDLKGRVTIPSKFREDLGDQFCVCRGLDGCLFVLSMKNMEEMKEKIDALPMAQARKAQRFLFSSAAVVEPDKQGRILLPLNLRQYADLEKEAVVIGAASHAEIWSAERWAEYNQQQDAASIEEIMNLF